VRPSPALWLYRRATSLAGPFAAAWLSARARKGKEDPARIGERYGRYAQARPQGTLVWMHAASVGESGVALALIEAMADADAGLQFLLSTGTRTSAALAAKRAPARTTHVYVPLDRADAVRRFLDHWRPDLGVFVESELWPNLILEAAARAPLALVNARMSPSSLRRWTRWRAAGERLLGAFAYVSAADARTAEALSSLRGEKVAAAGNLKLAAPAPGVDRAAQAGLAAEIGGRPMWLAASTHRGEDAIVLAAHDTLRAAQPDALLVIAPRHPERGAEVAALAHGAPRRARGEAIGDAPVYVADTLGELGLFYALAPAALVAGSLLPHLKGHNPIEPAKLGAAIVSGPHVESFDDIFAALFEAGGAVCAERAEDIAAAVQMLWRDGAARTRQAEAARTVVARGGEAFAATVAKLLSLASARNETAHATA